MPATDAKCLLCHENQAGLHASNQIDLFTMSMPGHPDVRLSGNCAACHMEHQGREHDLTAVSDQTCVKCHADLANEGTKMVAASSGKPPLPGIAPDPVPSPAPSPAPEAVKPAEGGAK